MSPTRRALFVEGGQTFLGVVSLDDVADGLDGILDREAILEIIGARGGAGQDDGARRRVISATRSRTA